MEKNLYPRLTLKRGGKPQPVAQCDYETGEVLTTYPSIKDAAIAMGASSTMNLLIALDKPNRTAYGYKWVRKHTPTPTDTQNPVYDP